MACVLAHLAEITARRDRDAMDAGLVEAVAKVYRPLQVALHRSVGEPADARWLTCAQMAPGDAVVRPSATWLEVAEMPALGAHAERHACLVDNRIVHLPGLPAQIYFPIGSGGGIASGSVLEVRTTEQLGADALGDIANMLRVWSHFRSLLDDSERDSLTGLLNRKSFDESFLRLAMAKPPPAPDSDSGAVDLRRDGARAGGWLAVLDVDHFKRVNDQFGHLIGDEVLLLLAQLMRNNFRVDDHIYRFGGEEFVVLMRCASREDAGRALERLRTAVEDHPFPQVGRITASIGFTELRSGDSPSSAFERADQAVYFAKQNGRNRVCDHAELVSAGNLAEARRDSDIELF